MIEIRSYRRVFDLERRIYSVDRFRLNPAGVPVRGVVYCLIAILTALAFTSMPLLASLSGAVPWYLKDLIVPVGMGSAASIIRVEGRTFHLAVRGLLGGLAGPRRVSGLTRASRAGERWVPPDLLQLPDGSGGRLRRFSYRGPGAVLVRVEHDRLGVDERRLIRFRRDGSSLRLIGPSRARRLQSGVVISLGRGGRLLVGLRTDSGR